MRWSFQTIRVQFMKKFAFALLVVFLFVPYFTFGQKSAAVPAAQNPQTIAVSQIHPGMRGVAYTVFQGVKPEAMDVEVLGVLHNVNGPKGDIILVRLHGSKPEYTGVVAGMSGSPVYFNGKLAGALAFRIGEFSKEPIAGVTPIAEMFEISALDHSAARSPALPSLRAGLSRTNAGENSAAAQASSPGESSGVPDQNYSDYLRP